MLILGIETSCDETAASLIEIKDGKIKVLSNTISSQVKLHAKYGGVVPSLAAREHLKNIGHVLKLAAGKIGLKKINLVAVTRGPGLISSLLVGTSFAKTLAWKLKKPTVGVNHIEGHIISNWLKTKGEAFDFQPPRLKKVFPAMCLVVSGGHTQLILMKDFGKYKTVGETIDDAAGEAFDKIARILKLGYPGGPKISTEAERFKTSKFKLGIELPRPMINSKNFDFSFAGLKTSVLYLVRDITKSYPLSRVRTEVAHEAQEAIIDVLVSKTVKAAVKYGVRSVILAGGVSANRLLRARLQKDARQKSLQYLQPEMEYTTDNAAMIALAGYFNSLRNKKRTDWKSVLVDANLAI